MSGPVLIYDGHCNFCRRQAARMLALAKGRLRLESFHDNGVLERHPLSREACEAAMQYISANGAVFSGAAAAAEIFRLNPFLSWLTPLYYIPGIKQISDAVYAWVARNRFRFGGSCTDGACAHR